jgi:protein ImuB
MNELTVDALRRCERRANRRDTRPVLVVHEEHQKQVVVACCARAADAGARPGLAGAQARALFGPGRVRIVPEDPQRDRRALHAIGLWAHKFSPVVALDEPDGLLLDISGCAPVFGSEENILAALLDGLTKLHFHAHAAIAPTFACAWAIARFGCGPQAIIPDGDERQALKKLPVDALGIDAGAVRALAEVGIERIGEVLDLPRSVLPSRFGDELLLRMDRALGHAIELIEPMQPTDPVTSELLFDGPTTRLDAIEHAVRMVLENLAGQLTRRGVGALRVDLELGRSDLDPAPMVIEMSRPTHDGPHLWSLVRPKLERVHLGFGVERVSGLVSRSGRCVFEQGERWREGVGRPDAEVSRLGSQLLDTLVNRLGHLRVTRGELVESHIPERAFVMRCVLEGVVSVGVRTRGLRPSVVFEQPIPIEVMTLTPDGPIRRVQLGGRDLDVVRCVGPERIAPEWWHRVGERAAGNRPPLFQDGERDYFRVQIESGWWLWICACGGRWSVRGAW